MNEELLIQLRDLHHGDHLSFIYDDPAEQVEVIGPYMKLGIDSGEFCLFMTDMLREEQIVAALESCGIDVARERERGALMIIPAREAYLVDGRFDPDRTITFLAETIEDVCRRGFTGFRGTAEMSWALSGAPGCELLASYESRINDMFPGKRATALCQYHRSAFPPAAIRDVMRTHARMIYDGRVCESLFFESSNLFHERCSEGERVEWMLDRTRRAHDARAVRELMAAERAAREAAERAAATELSLRNEAENANRAKNRFLATVSHELRTPLTSALAWTWLLQQNEVSPGNQSSLEALSNSIRRQMRLVDDLLDIARIDAGRLSFQLEPIDFRATVQSVVESLRITAEAKGVSVVTTLHPSPILILADRLRVEQIVINLAANAIKFTPAGGTVEVSVTRDAAGANLIVRDTGVGMEEGFVPHAFDTFTQESDGLQREYGGMGLGLSIARQMVELHGGTMTARSDGRGRGSTFDVRLPFGAKHPPIRPIDSSARIPILEEEDSRRLQELRILVVDDDADSCTVLARVLERFSADVRTAGSTAAALTEFHRFQPSVVVTDVAMPGEDGCALLQRLKEIGTAPVIALTAHADVATQNFLLGLGFDSALGKPIEPMTLVRAVAGAGRPTSQRS